MFPKEFTCDGADTSPLITWSVPPPESRSLALTLTDPDAPQGTFTHWVLYNLPPSADGLGKAEPKQDQLPDGSLQGQNDFSKGGYGGPCPPSGAPHRYVFTIFALDRRLDLGPRTTRARLESAMQGHILAKGALIARYGR
jgi:Raf kinase inhibitor-like YbhB/YbcL family protein